MARWMALSTTSAVTALWLMSRVPSRITSRALVKLAAAISIAVSANITASSVGRSNVSNMICCTELR